MLNIMRRHASSWWIKVLLIAVALSFIVGFGILTTFREDDRDRYVAKVDDTIITPDDFSNAFLRELEILREKYGEELTDEQIENLDLKWTVLNSQIDTILELKYARKLNIPVSNEEIAELIAMTPYFQENGEFSYDLYTQVLRYNGLSEAQYESLVREDLTIEKMRNVIRDSVKVSDREVLSVVQSQGLSIESLDELTPDDREYYTRTALAIKKFQAYGKFLNRLYSKADIDINTSYLE
jgi:peptidyl-prolyl cis-trans isomerase D